VPLRAHELQILICAGDASAVRVQPEWRRVDASENLRR
jgi:hypothetical protein